MTQSNDLLSEGLTRVAEGVKPIDLFDRALARSRQIGRRLTAWTLAGLAVTVAMVGAGSVQVAARNSAAATVPGTSTGIPSAVPTEPTPSPSATPGAFPVVDLENATVTVPPFPEREGVGPCPTDNVPIVDGSYALPDGSVSVRVVDSMSVELDADAALETVGVFVCYGPAESGVGQVVAFQGTTAETLTLMGQVVGPVAGVGGDITGVGGIEAAKGAVRVEVTSLAKVLAGSSTPDLSTVRQWRTFAWDGTRFTQIAGSTTFAADTSTAKLTGTATRLVFDPPDGACRSGELTITVRNEGPRVAADVTAAVILPEYEPETCPNPPPGQRYGSVLAEFGTIAAGVSRSVTVRVVTPVIDGVRDPSGTVVDQPYNYFELRTRDQSYLDRTRVIVEYR